MSVSCACCCAMSVRTVCPVVGRMCIYDVKIIPREDTSNVKSMSSIVFFHQYLFFFQFVFVKLVCFLPFGLCTHSTRMHLLCRVCVFKTVHTVPATEWAVLYRLSTGSKRLKVFLSFFFGYKFPPLSNHTLYSFFRSLAALKWPQTERDGCIKWDVAHQAHALSYPTTQALFFLFWICILIQRSLSFLLPSFLPSFSLPSPFLPSFLNLFWHCRTISIWITCWSGLLLPGGSG